MKFGFKRRLVKGAPVEDVGFVRSTGGESAMTKYGKPYTADELETIMATVRPLTLEETQLAAKNRREAAGDRAAMETWYASEVH